MIKEIDKMSVIEFEDEEGMHLIPLSSISTLSAEKGIYDYRENRYGIQYKQTRYVLRTKGKEVFNLSKSFYEELKDALFKTELKGKQTDGNYWMK